MTSTPSPIAKRAIPVPGELLVWADIGFTVCKATAKRELRDEPVATGMGADEEELGGAQVAPRAAAVPDLRGGSCDGARDRLGRAWGLPHRRWSERDRRPARRTRALRLVVRLDLL